MDNVRELYPSPLRHQGGGWFTTGPLSDFDRECDTAIVMANPTPTEPSGIPVPWFTLLQGPASDPELDPEPEPEPGIPVTTFAVAVSAYFIGVGQILLMSRLFW